jgi:dienelactone hydrolase
MPSNDPNSKKTSLIVATILLALLLGASLDRKLEILPMVKQLFIQDVSLQTLPIDSDPNLQDYSHVQRNAAAPAGGFSEWQENTRKLIVETAGSDIIPAAGVVPRFRVLEEETLANGVVRRLIAFTTFDESEIPAYLHLPPGQRKLPAILVIPGHVKEGESGIEQTALLDDSYQHAAARSLAERGFITLTPELRGFGYLGVPYQTEHTIVAYNALLEGTSYKWVVLKDLGYAMRLLRQLDRVDAQRTGVTGASYGGELAVNYGALDTDVKAVAFQAYGGSIGVKPSQKGDKHSQPHYCHILPSIDRMMSQEEWLWLLAPRPTLGVRGDSDRVFKESVVSIYQKGWELAGAQNRPLLISVEGGHEYFVDPAIDFFREAL